MKRSKWFGLWNNDEKHYMVSQPINIEELKTFIDNDNFRLIIKKNKYYKKDSNRPYYNFAIGDTYGSSTNAITSEDMQYDNLLDNLEEMSEYEICDFIEENYGIRLFTYSKVQEVMHEANYDGTQGYTDIILEDYI